MLVSESLPFRYLPLLTLPDCVLVYHTEPARPAVERLFRWGVVAIVSVRHAQFGAVVTRPRWTPVIPITHPSFTIGQQRIRLHIKLWRTDGRPCAKSILWRYPPKGVYYIHDEAGKNACISSGLQIFDQATSRSTP